MTVKTTNYGGTDWSDGDILYAADLNDTFDAGDRQKHYIEAAQTGNGASSTSWQTLKTITPTNGKCTWVKWDVLFAQQAGGGGTATGRIQVTYDDATTEESAEFSCSGVPGDITDFARSTGEINAASGKFITSIKLQGKGDGTAIPSYNDSYGSDARALPSVHYNDLY